MTFDNGCGSATDGDGGFIMCREKAWWGLGEEGVSLLRRRTRTTGGRWEGFGGKFEHQISLVPFAIWMIRGRHGKLVIGGGSGRRERGQERRAKPQREGFWKASGVSVSQIGDERGWGALGEEGAAVFGMPHGRRRQTKTGHLQSLACCEAAAPCAPPSKSTALGIASHCLTLLPFSPPAPRHPLLSLLVSTISSIISPTAGSVLLRLAVSALPPTKSRPAHSTPSQPCSPSTARVNTLRLITHYHLSPTTSAFRPFYPSPRRRFDHNLNSPSHPAAFAYSRALCPPHLPIPTRPLTHSTDRPTDDTTAAAITTTHVVHSASLPRTTHGPSLFALPLPAHHSLAVSPRSSSQHLTSRHTTTAISTHTHTRAHTLLASHRTTTSGLKADAQLPVRVGVNLQRRKAASSNACKNTFWNVMVTRKPSSQFTSSSTSSSRCSSLYPPSALTEGWSADEADEMSGDESPPRPLSVAIPKVAGAHGPYCPRRPNLREILANTSPPPWTLAAFMAYLSNNHCLETLEFTMDAGRYKKHYAKMMSKAEGDDAPPATDKDYVQLLWTRLIDAYIQPNGSREVNLPSEVRDPILNLEIGLLPPPPEKLDPAVAKIYELMEESVLVPFINSCYPQSAAPTVSSMPVNASSDSLSGSNSATVGSAPQTFKRHGRHVRSSPPPQSAVEPYAHTYSAPSMLNRKSAPSTLTTTLHKARFSMRLSPTSASPSQSNPPNAIAPFASATSGTSDTTVSASGSGSATGTTDDSNSTSSPVAESPMTPPTSPPIGDLASPAHSPRTSRDSNNVWKKLGRLSGMKVGKKKSHAGLKDEHQQQQHQQQ
ncbi:hypothetical protein Q7P37_008904 [Cladosporium fusiforme]